MRCMNPFAKTLKAFSPTSSHAAQLYSLPALAKQFPNIAKLPVSMRIVLESVLRHCDGVKVTADHVAQVANWQPNAPRVDEIPFTVSRVVLQDFTGVPLLADLAAMRNVAKRLGKDPKRVEPLVPVDLVVDHSVMVDHYGSKDALDLNMKLEFQRNRERYEFMKWGMQAFDTFKVVPPGFGIVHQVNLEYLARGVFSTNGKAPVYYPDSLVGTDSHTTMINGLGVVGWGVGGIEAEAAMLGQPVYFLTPDVVGFKFTGALRGGVTATDLVLTVTEMLRKAKVVGKFVEFFGPGTASLSLPDRATIANMAPEYGATMGFFPVDDKTLAYLEGTGRTKAQVQAFANYFKAQGMYGIPGTKEFDKVNKAEIAYSQVLELDLASVAPSLAGPKRPQDRIEIGSVAQRFDQLFSAPMSAPGADSGFGQPAAKLAQTFKTTDGIDVKNGDVLIAAITSCTNTSNPGVLLAAGLLAKKAVKAGLKVAPHVKTSLAPGSRIVTEYLEATGLLPYLQQLGFHIAGYGCTTCIGNAGDLTPELNEAITSNDLIAASVLSGNRNFEARIHPNLKANFLASPPLVVAYAIAGNMRVDLMTQPLGHNAKGQPVYIGDVWPTTEEVLKLIKHAMKPKAFQANYANVAKKPGKLWEAISGKPGQVYTWPKSSYIAEPPFFADFADLGKAANDKPWALQGARVMALFGDSITTDHISPAGSIKDTSPAGRWLQERGVMKADFNSYGARRGHHDVMMRGTFANVRIKNLIIPPKADGTREEGGVTLHQPSGDKLAIFDAAQRYQADNVPTVIFAGEEYGTGSSRDWAAKGTALLGIKAVVAKSFERIHRSNLVGMGVLPLQFQNGESWESLGIQASDTISMALLGGVKAQSQAELTITRANGSTQKTKLLVRIDTPIEVDYFNSGGILPFVLKDLLAA
jgi:aconitate hydratase